MEICANIIILNELIINPIGGGRIEMPQLDEIPNTIMNYTLNVSVNLNKLIKITDLKKLIKYIFD
jgi:hypothetical protein